MDCYSDTVVSVQIIGSGLCLFGISSGQVTFFNFETGEKIFFNGYKTENAQVRMTLKKSSPFALEFSVTVEPDNKKHYWNFECSPEQK